MTLPDVTEYTAAKGRKFGLTLGIAFGVLAAFLLWRGQEGAPRFLGALSVTLAGMGLVAPKLLKPVETGWMKFAELLSKVTTPLFMGIIYFALFTVVGALRRAFGANSLKHGDASTAWEPHLIPSDLNRQF